MNHNKDIKVKSTCNSYVRTIYISFSKSCHAQIISQFSIMFFTIGNKGKFSNQCNLFWIFCPQETVKQRPYKHSLYKGYYCHFTDILSAGISTHVYAHFWDFHPEHTSQFNLVIHTSFQHSPIFLKIIYMYNVLNEQQMFNAHGWKISFNSPNPHAISTIIITILHR